MPRLRPSLFWLARQKISPLAALLLRVCRDLRSAADELRWMREHIDATPSRIPPRLRLWQFCERRSRGVPLQYILGTQPFGDLEILCRQGVLIPRCVSNPSLRGKHHWLNTRYDIRPETEPYTLQLAQLMLAPSSSAQPKDVNILDLCTGTGCIALQLYASLRRRRHVHVHVHGVDVSPKAIALARENARHNVRPGRLQQPLGTIQFTQADIFSDDVLVRLRDRNWDVLVSNPPYLSRGAFARDTARSVRNYEPRLALVPEERVGTTPAAARCAPADVFYARLLSLSAALRPTRVLLEVAGVKQAVRVVKMAGEDPLLCELYPQVEIWRDHPHPEYQQLDIDQRQVPLRGSGSARAVYLSRAGQ